MLADSSRSCTRTAGHLVVQESTFPFVVLGTMETTDLLFLGSNEERVEKRLPRALLSTKKEPSLAPLPSLRHLTTLGFGLKIERIFKDKSNIYLYIFPTQETIEML